MGGGSHTSRESYSGLCSLLCETFISLPCKATLQRVNQTKKWFVNGIVLEIMIRFSGRALALECKTTFKMHRTKQASIHSSTRKDSFTTCARPQDLTGPKGLGSVLRPVSSSWIIIILWLYIALRRTPNINCYWGGEGGGSTQGLGFSPKGPGAQIWAVKGPKL